MIIEISVPDSFCIYTIEISVLFLIVAGEEKQSNFTDCKNSWQGTGWDVGFGTEHRAWSIQRDERDERSGETGIFSRQLTAGSRRKE